MKKHFFTVVVAAFTLASCSTFGDFTTTNVTSTLEYMESSARVLEADHNMLLTPVIADIEVSSKKISYTEKEMFANLEVTQALLKNISELKKIALSRAARDKAIFFSSERFFNNACVTSKFANISFSV